MDLVQLIKDEALRSRGPMTQRAPTLYPSSGHTITKSGRKIGGCQRETWYRLHGVPQSDPMDFHIYWTTVLGKSIENEVSRQMQNKGIYEASSVKFYDSTTRISGELDVVGRYRRPDGSVGKYAVEVKSCYGQGATKTITGRSRKYRGQDPFPPKPKDSHLIQTMLYLWYFSGEKGKGGKLDHAELVYFPRDKPIDGRNYTIRLTTKEFLEERGSMPEFSEKMDPGKHYAVISTIGYETIIETEFAIEDVLDQYKDILRRLDEKDPPSRTYSLFYSKEEIEHLYKLSDISASRYDKWKKKGEPEDLFGVTPGHFLCASYCKYRSFCYLRNGQPNPEADLVGVEEPREAQNEDADEQP